MAWLARIVLVLASPGAMARGAAPLDAAADSSLKTAQASARAVAIRGEYLPDSLALDVPRPRLSSQVRAEASRRGVRQTAYQIWVASSPEILAGGKGDLWDSGKVESSESLQIQYAGKPLVSRLRCFWTVRVRDQDGQASG